MSTTIGLEAQELAAGNPWWRDPNNWHATDKDLKAARESGINYESEVLAGLVEGCLYILCGPRRAGKTVAVKQTIKLLLDSGVKPTQIIRVSTDGWSARELKNLVLHTIKPPLPEGGNRYWFIDEVSAIAGDWDLVLKNLRDEDPQFGADTIVLTGSNSARLEEAKGVLADRRGSSANVDRTLFPMGFASFVKILAAEPLPPRTQLDLSALHSPAAKQAFEDLIPWLSQLVQLWEIYIQYGGFPAAVASAKAGNSIEPSFLKAMFDVIQKDAFKASRIKNSTSMSLQERLWEGMASPLNITRVATKVGVVPETLRGHMQYLRDAFLIWDCPKLLVGGGWTPHSGAQNKVYAIDPLIARLPYLRNKNRKDIDPTVLTEMQIGMALKRRIASENESASWDDYVFYARVGDDKEIDFVSPYLGNLALEGKYVQGSSWLRDAATVNATQWKGILATRNVLDASSDQAWAVPASFLCYLLDT